MKSTTILLLLFFQFTLAFSQTTYYVDATNGNDANDGTSEESPWKSIEEVNNQAYNNTFSPGDRILFKRGEVWIGERLEIADISGTESAPIEFGAYPDNNDVKPVITVITEHLLTWSDQGNGLWKAAPSPTYHPDRLWVDGKEILRANNKNELDGTNFLWYYTKDEDGDLYLYSEEDPSTKTIEFYNDKCPLYLENVKYITFSNLALEGGWTSVFINAYASHVIFDEMQIGKKASTGIDINSEENNKPNNIYISNCIFDSDFTLDYSMAGTYRGSDNRGCGDALFIQAAEYCEIYDNYFKNWGHASINIDGNPYDADEVKVSHIVVHDNEATSPDICYGGRMAIDDAHDCKIYNNLIINTSVQCQFNGSNNHIHHNIIDGTRNPPIVDKDDEISAGIDLCGYSSGAISGNIYENNIIKNIEGVGIQFSTCGDYDIYSNIFRNNIILNCGTIDDVENIAILIKEDADSKTYDNQFTNNLIFKDNATNTINFRDQITDISGFNNLDGTSDYQISNNIAEDPLFVDPANADYHLQSGSPCIDAGTTPLAVKDFEGKTIPYADTKPDIGIYEYEEPTFIKTPAEDIISIFPNPTNSYIKIKKADDIIITDIRLIKYNGELVSSYNINMSYIDISMLKPGVYILIITTNKGKQVKKVIVN